MHCKNQAVNITTSEVKFTTKSIHYRKGSNYSAKKNNSRRGLALELERKKSASIRVATYIDYTLEL